MSSLGERIKKAEKEKKDAVVFVMKNGHQIVFDAPIEKVEENFEVIDLT